MDNSGNNKSDQNENDVAGARSNQCQVMSDRSVVEFALKIATALKDSQSSTALFFIQQAYPDNIDMPSDQPTATEILDNVITTATLALKT